MKILDKLEHDILHDCVQPGDATKAFPVLIRVARAAERVYIEYPGGHNQRRELKVLEEALQQLRNLSRDTGLAELVAMQQEMGLDRE